MEASSRQALAIVRERLDERTRGAAGDALLALADELFAVARVLDEQPTLRRGLADPGVRPQDRAALAQRLLASRLSATAVDVVETVARQRWSRPFDLVQATETLAIEASLDAADARGELDGVEDELFRFGRIVGGNAELSRILSDRSGPAEGKKALLGRLLSDRVSPVTEQLLTSVLAAGRIANAEVAVERLSGVASRRRGRSVATVTSAVPLTDAQEQRLAAILTRIYGRPVGLQTTVDPEVLGGLVIRVGDEVIDGSIAQRLETARRRLAG